MAKGNGPLPEGQNQASDGDQKVAAAGPPVAVNTKQRASTVIRQLKLSKPVAAGVLAQHGLTKLSMVDPAVFAQQVTDWLASPAQK